MDFHSQAGQDKFVVMMLKAKKNGHFLELGGYEPVNDSNTCVLEKQLGWKGFIIEHNNVFLPKYIKERPNSIPIIGDATQQNYRKLLDDHQFPVNMDYLQIDLDVNNRSTLTSLEIINQTVFGKYTFATVTFEHDIYTGDFFDTRVKSREIFTSRGYLRLFTDVCVFWPDHWSSFEDWYIHPALVDMKFVTSILNDMENTPYIPWPKAVEIVTKHTQ